MVEICYSSGSDRIFRFGGLHDVLPEKYQPLTEWGNEFVFFWDMFRQQGILIIEKGQQQPDGTMEYPCSCGGIGFTMIYDTCNNTVNFRADDPAQRETLAQRLKALILEASGKSGN